jgi:hypothetical protein
MGLPVQARDCSNEVIFLVEGLDQSQPAYVFA